MARWWRSRSRSAKNWRRRSRYRSARRPVTLRHCIVMKYCLDAAKCQKEALEIQVSEKRKQAMELLNEAVLFNIRSQEYDVDIASLKRRFSHLDVDFLESLDAPVKVDYLEEYKYVTQELTVEAVLAENTSYAARRDIAAFVKKVKDEEGGGGGGGGGRERGRGRGGEWLNFGGGNRRRMVEFWGSNKRMRRRMKVEL